MLRRELDRGLSFGVECRYAERRRIPECQCATGTQMAASLMWTGKRRLTRLLTRHALTAAIHLEPSAHPLARLHRPPAKQTGEEDQEPDGA